MSSISPRQKENCLFSEKEKQWFALVSQKKSKFLVHSLFSFSVLTFQSSRY